jgi:hypothetical protein
MADGKRVLKHFSFTIHQAKAIRANAAQPATKIIYLFYAPAILKGKTKF